MTRFKSLGLLMLASVGGATGGYILRIRQDKGKPQQPPSDQDPAHMVNATPGKTKQPPRVDPP